MKLNEVCVGHYTSVSGSTTIKLLYLNIVTCFFTVFLVFKEFQRYICNDLTVINKVFTDAVIITTL